VVLHLFGEAGVTVQQRAQIALLLEDLLCLVRIVQKSCAAVISSSAVSRAVFPGRSKIHLELLKLALQLVQAALQIGNHELLPSPAPGRQSVSEHTRRPGNRPPGKDKQKKKQLFNKARKQ